MPLTLAAAGEENIIRKVGGNPEVKKHLEDLGFDLQQFAHKPMKHALIFCAFTMKTSEEAAAKEIQDHIKGGGSLDDIFNAIAGAIQNSDFFRSALPAAEKKAGTKKASKGGTAKR